MTRVTGFLGAGGAVAARVVVPSLLVGGGGGVVGLRAASSAFLRSAEPRRSERYGARILFIREDYTHHSRKSQNGHRYHTLVFLTSVLDTAGDGTDRNITIVHLYK